jgi:hypothetical protein
MDGRTCLSIKRSRYALRANKPKYAPQNVRTSWMLLVTRLWNACFVENFFTLHWLMNFPKSIQILRWNKCKPYKFCSYNCFMTYGVFYYSTVFEVFTVVRSQVEISIVTPHSVTVGYQRFGGPCCLRPHSEQGVLISCINFHVLF